MKVLYHNVYIARRPEAVIPTLQEMIGNWNPHVVGLGEASRVGPYVGKISGYRDFWLRELYRGRGDTVVLVRDDVELTDWNWVKFKKWWKGPKHGLPQGPKRFWNGRIHDDNLGTVRLSIGHWPFNTALPECEAWCATWFNRAKTGRISVHLGDLNMGPVETGLFTKRFGGEHTGHLIDRAMFKNCHVTARDLGHHGSDHPAILFTIEK